MQNLERKKGRQMNFSKNTSNVAHSTAQESRYWKTKKIFLNPNP
jgi:hypothetical protein